MLKNRWLTLIFFVLIILLVTYLFAKGLHLTSRVIGLSEKTKTSRPDYCMDVDGERKCVDPEIFKFLPEYPADFMHVYELVYYGRINDLSKVDEKYWKQPEIIPTWKTSGVNLYINPEKGRFGAFGFGCYPAEASATVKPGQAVRLTTWLHTSWAVQNLQGMSLNIVYPSHADSESGITVEQDPSVSKYFDSSVSPNLVLLGPTWPYFESDEYFDHDGWIVPISLDIKVHHDAPSGLYAVGVMPTSPPKNMNDEWTLKYKLRYTPIQYYNIGRPYFTAFLKVE